MKRQVSVGEKRLVMVSCGAVALLAGVVWWHKSLDADPQIILPTPVKAPNPNGFDFYLKAAKLLVPGNPPVDSSMDLNPPQDEQARKQRYSPERKEAWLLQNTSAFGVLQRALGMPCVSPAFHEHETDKAFDLMLEIRNLARAKRVESRVRALHGDWSGSMQSRLDTMQIGSDVTRGGVIISSLVCNAVHAIARNNAWNEVEHLSAAEARQAAKRLEGLYERRPLFVDIMRADKLYTLIDLRKQLRNPQWRDMDRWAKENWLGEQPNWRDRLTAAFISKQQVIDNAGAILDVTISNAQQPFTAAQKPLPASNNPFTRDIASLPYTRVAFAQNDAANAMWLVALALHCYKEEQGAYPQSLSELIPSYLKQIPADPFGGGEPLRYKRTGLSYTLWSIGPDGVDNGGRPITHDAKLGALKPGSLPRVMPDTKGDFVWGKNQ